MAHEANATIINHEKKNNGNITILSLGILLWRAFLHCVFVYSVTNTTFRCVLMFVVCSDSGRAHTYGSFTGNVVGIEVKELMWVTGLAIDLTLDAEMRTDS